MKFLKRFIRYLKGGGNVWGLCHCFEPKGTWIVLPRKEDTWKKCLRCNGVMEDD